jgi:uncharacterized sulfatase
MEPRENMSRKNLVWLVFDSVRGDRTTLGGHDRDTTPNMARVGERDDAVAGTCFAHAIWSQPSVASMLTGTPPATHGAGLHNETLPTEIPTVAERFAEAGYATSGLSVNPFFSETTGADRGFERFGFHGIGEVARRVGLSGLASFLLNVRRFSAGFDLTKRKHSPDFLFNELVQQEAARLTDGDRPFFLCAHYHGVHHSYYPSPAFQDHFFDGDRATAREAAELAFEHTTDVYEEIARGCPLTEAEREQFRTVYDTQVYQTDALVDRLLAHIDDLGLDEDTVVVVTADHGDLLGEYDLLSHKLVLHDALLEVPLLVRGSKRLLEADLSLAQHADVMQEILTELGVDTEGMCGRPLVDGGPDVAVAQRGAATKRRTYERVRETTADFEHEATQRGLVTALRTADWKYLRGADSERLHALPDEETDRSAAHPDRLAALRRRLDEWEATVPDPVEGGADVEFEADVEARLADLGYVTD